MRTRTVTLDVREDIRSGREPFAAIMNAIARLRPDQQLLLVAPFEPVPLFDVLAKQGFAHEARQTDSGDWEVRFTREKGGASAAEATPAVPRRSPASSASLVEVDARGLEPPQPMVKILEALAALPGGAELRARTDRRPMHLYAQLEARGFMGESEEQPDGSYITHIRRR